MLARFSKPFPAVKMMKSTDKTERKKKFEEFFSLAGAPFVLAAANSIVLKMALIAFNGADVAARVFSADPSRGRITDIHWLSFGLMFLLTYFWFRPAFAYVGKPDEKLKAAVRARIDNIYRDGVLMLGIAGAAVLALIYGKLGALPAVVFPAMAAALLAQTAALTVYIDWTLSRQKLLMDALYPGDSGAGPRSGFCVPIYFKVSLMAVSCSILPFGLIYAAVRNGVRLNEFSIDLCALMALSSAVLLAGLGGIYHGVQKPLNGLISKMKRVSLGDYDVRTRIYFSDEISRLKNGFNEMAEGLKEREELRETFGRYMSIEVARELLKNKKVNLGGEHLEAAVMFCDIRNFTPLSENMSAAQVVEFLNAYFSYITQPITANSGVISKFIGDAVMAVYTPMMGSENYAADAVRSALAMRRALAEFNASGKSPGPVRFGIGIQTGGLVAGNIGTLSRLEYTFIGDTVNIASRLESKTKELGTDILVSGTVRQKVGDALHGETRFESVGLIPLKGKAEPLELFKVLDK